MFPMLFQHNYFYYIIIGLQVICAIHCIRNGTQNKWIWFIVFVPVVGSLVYLFTEVLTRTSRSNLQQGISGILVTSSARIKRLEENLKFTDTFNNRVLLADAYLAAGHTDSAIELYESSLTGAFEENEHVIMQLIIAYFNKEDYARIQPLVKKVYARPQFARSKAHVLYAIALEKTGDLVLAEQEFKKMKARFSHFEARLQYGLFLKRAGREEEARQVFMDMVDEAPHLSSRERRDSRAWIGQARAELNVRQKS
jgi:hypothetical protein